MPEGIFKFWLVGVYVQRSSWALCCFALDFSSHVKNIFILGSWFVSHSFLQLFSSCLELIVRHGNFLYMFDEKMNNISNALLGHVFLLEECFYWWVCNILGHDFILFFGHLTAFGHDFILQRRTLTSRDGFPAASWQQPRKKKTSSPALRFHSNRGWASLPCLSFSLQFYEVNFSVMKWFESRIPFSLHLYGRPNKTDMEWKFRPLPPFHFTFTLFRWKQTGPRSRNQKLRFLTRRLWTVSMNCKKVPCCSIMRSDVQL